MYDKGIERLAFVTLHGPARLQRTAARCQAALDRRQPPEYYEAIDENEEEENDDDND